jgi:hypothetical protein
MKFTFHLPETNFLSRQLSAFHDHNLHIALVVKQIDNARSTFGSKYIKGPVIARHEAIFSC